MRVIETMQRPLTGILVAMAVSAGPLAPEALAQATAARPAPDSGDTAWMMTATALVLLMTVPGVALFYGGMVRKMNVLAMAMQSFAICCLVPVLWMGPGLGLPLAGGLSRGSVRKDEGR